MYLVSHNSVISLPPSGFVIIGRDNHCNVVVNNSSVSRNHCKLIINGNSTAVEDLNSSNGTYVNNVLIQPNLKTPLNRGDILRLGDEEFQIK
ncbi:MAG: FHA domain-containing protein [Anaerolineaceae bacterium]|nr:FHA domain-containing protein [Anaerolineaceae bacterium]